MVLNLLSHLSSRSLGLSVAPRRLPHHIISAILSFCIVTEDDVDLNTNLRARHNENPEPSTNTRFKAAQASLAAALCVSSAWAYAGLPALYKYPLISSGDALRAFVAALDAHPDRAHFVRALVCLPFQATYGQIRRSDMPTVARRAQLRASYGSYADLIRILASCDKLHALGLRFTEPRTILPIATYIKAHTLYSLAICGTCIGQPYRLRLNLCQIMTPSLNLPYLEDLSLEDFTVDPDTPVVWPSFPALRTFRLLRTWVSNIECAVVPPDCPRLENVDLGLAPLSAEDAIRNGLVSHHERLLSLRVVGSRSWHCGAVDLSEFSRLQSLVLESTLCGYGPPAIEKLPPHLRSLTIYRGNSNDDFPPWISRTVEVVCESDNARLVELVFRGYEIPNHKKDILEIMLSSAAESRNIKYRHELQVPMSSRSPGIQCEWC